MATRDKNFLKVFWPFVILVFVGSVTSFLSIYIIKMLGIPERPVVQKIEEKPSQYPDYDTIKGLDPDPKIKAIKFTADCPSGGCISDEPATVNFDGIEKKYLVKGELSRAYFYIEAAVDYKRPLTNYDDFYFSLNTWGGHLLTSENILPVPPGDLSRYLYDLRSISYFVREGIEKRKVGNINFFAFLQNGTTFKVRVTVSSDRPGRVIKEASFYYQCADGSDCSIEES